MTSDLDPRSTNIDGLWTNPTGAALELTSDGASLSGVYRTAVGAAQLGKAYPLVGWRDRKVLGFSVSWGPDSESLTSWSGLIDRDKDGELIISAMWLLVSGAAIRKDGETTDTQPWEAFRTQAVTFRRSGP